MVFLLALNVSLFVGCAELNRYQTDGSQVIKGLDGPVKVVRDEKTEKGFRVETIEICLTKPGPVVSDVLKGLQTDNVLSIRWAAYATMSPTVGFIPMPRIRLRHT